MSAPKWKRGLIAALAVLALVWGGTTLGRWFGHGPLKRDASFTVPEGTTLARLATRLEQAGAVRSADSFRLRARILGGGGDIKAGEFLLPKGASEREILAIVEGDEVLRRFVTVPEGMPSIMVYERLNAQKGLTGTISVPAEGSVLPDTYEVAINESRSAVVARMQAAMNKVLAEEWAGRGANLAVKTPQEALTLASIVEKETGKPSERTMVAGLYGNRLRIGMPLQADPTIIYPITKGKPLGRRILRSEIRAVNDYNTYSMAGLPTGPITNPGRASIHAVLHPAPTKALYMVADGTGGHVFADTLEQHNANVAKWMKLRHERGEID